MLSQYDMENTEAHYIKVQCEQTIDTVHNLKHIHEVLF
jgi:hypothetical protein